MSDLGGHEPDAGLTLRLIGIEYAGVQTNCYRFASPDGAALPAASAGAHITLKLPNGLQRQYSLVSSGEGLREYIIGVKREANGKGGSICVHDQLRVGDLIEVLPPQNNFVLNEEAANTVLIGGGIGVTPLISMARRLSDLDRPFRFYVAFRSHHHALLGSVIDQLPNVTMHYDETEGSFFSMANAIASAPRDAHLYCCGPGPMIETFLECAKLNGRADDHVHVEFFEAVDEAATEGNFTVELVRSNLTLDIPPGASILDVVRDAGVDVPSSCEKGVCASCETKVLEGVPDHRDAVLSPAERKAGKSMMICCSGSLTKRLVLDL